MAANCPLTDKPMQCHFSFRDRQQSLFSTVSRTAVPVIGKNMCRVLVNDMPIFGLL